MDKNEIVLKLKKNYDEIKDKLIDKELFSHYLGEQFENECTNVDDINETNEEKKEEKKEDNSIKENGELNINIEKYEESNDNDNDEENDNGEENDDNEESENDDDNNEKKDENNNDEIVD